MSINSSLIKLANKIDTDGTSDITPDYKNPNNSIEKSIERIADNYESGGGSGGGGGVLVVHSTMTETSMTLDKTWKEIKDAPYAVYIDAYEDGGIWSQTFSPILSLDDDGGYNVLIAFPYVDGEAFKFVARTLTTDSEDGYPSATMG